MPIFLKKIFKRLQSDMYIIYDYTSFTTVNVRDKSLILGIYVYKRIHFNIT